MNKKIGLGAIWVGLLLLLVAGSAVAQTDLTSPDASFDGLLQLIQQQSGQWAGKLRGYAYAMFMGLAVIQFTWSMGQLVFKGADMGEILGELVRQIMVIGFWLAFLAFSVDWCSAIVNSFRQAAASASGTGESGLIPSDMFGLGVEMATVMGQTGMDNLLNPGAMLGIAFATALVLGCFAFIAALMAVALVESFFVINAGVLFMGFAGSSWTRDTALAFVKYSISVGAKLFVLTLLAGVVLSSAKSWAAAYDNSNASMWTLVGLAIVCAYMCKTVPDLIQALINGSSVSGGGAMGSMAAAGAAFGMAAAASIKTIATGGAGAPAAAGAIANAGNATAGAAGLGGMGAAGSGAGSSMTAGLGGGAASSGGAGQSAASLGGKFGAESAASGGAPSMDLKKPPVTESQGGTDAASGGKAGNAASQKSESAQGGTPGAATAGSDDGGGGNAGGGAASEASNGKEDDGGSSFGQRAAEGGRWAGKAAWAGAAMFTPGMEAAPDSSAFTGSMPPLGRADEGTDELQGRPSAPTITPPDEPANVIKPAPQPPAGKE